MTAVSEQQAATFGERAARHSALPLWEHMKRLVPEQPHTPVRATLWSYRQLRPMLLEACEMVSTEDAERRVLMLVNPELTAEGAAAPTLYAGLQVLLPGETAPNHRHTASAIRFVIEGHGAVTSVGGVAVPMEPGDLVLTPSWAWHEHTHAGEGPVVWLDALDIPIVNLLSSGFSERPTMDHDIRVNDNVPPRLHFPWAEVEATLRRRAAAEPPSPVDGIVYRYTNEPEGSLVPTASCTARWLPGGFRGLTARRTGNTVFHVARGSGRTFVGEDVFEWSPGDVFVVPSWVPFRHANDSGRDEAVFFAFSDDTVLKALGIYREEV